MYYLGCDQHKHYTVVMVKDDNGVLADQTKLYHQDRSSLKEYFASWPKDSLVALEASGFNPWLCDLIQEAGLEVKLAHPLKTKAIAEQRIKTDKISAGVLTDLLRCQLLPESYVAPPEVRQARQLIRYRLSLVQLRTMAKNKTHSLLDRLGLTPPEISDLFGDAGRIWLKDLALSAVYRQSLDGYLYFIDALETMIKELDGQIRSEVKEDPRLKLLTTMPGIGPILAFCILSEIGDINRFASSSKLACYAGLVPSLHQSGQILRQGHITKQGNRYLRWAFIEAAQTAVRHDPSVKLFYDKIRFKKGASVALVAVGRKLLTYAYQILKTQTPYRQNKIRHGESLRVRLVR